MQGLEKSHNRIKKKESQEACSKEFLELEKYSLCFEKHMQASTEENNQRYGWVMKREVRWNSLQVKLQQNMFVELKKELREVEPEMEVSCCETEQIPLLEDDDETKIEDYFLNTLICLELPDEDLVKTTDEESNVFRTDELCVFAGIA